MSERQNWSYYQKASVSPPAQPVSHSDIMRSNNPQANEVAGTQLPGNRFELISSKKKC